MNASTESPVVRLPRSALSSLFRRCGTLGESGIEALREAGDRVGAELLETLAASPATLPASEFWSRLDAAIRGAGLGSVSFRPADTGTGAISWRGSAEAPGRSPDEPCCHFATGVLGGVLSRTAHRPVAVVEVRCGGGQPCWFLFGAAERIRRVRGGRDTGRARR
ncbi:V4R domain-containing protein [Candidatus Palauibacter sp.]|uniref:V4R domain-containing protein n=1 Tax=Candidatus Palauibacter sp. TaxID=3101350 RepID=UPI003B019E24